MLGDMIDQFLVLESEVVGALLESFAVVVELVDSVEQDLVLFGGECSSHGVINLLQLGCHALLVDVEIEGVV
jgi:hypothetical protein